MNKCFGRTITIIITLCVIFILESSEIMIAAAQSEYLISSLNGKYKPKGEHRCLMTAYVWNGRPPELNFRLSVQAMSQLR
ncbi:MAG: hypothetical protein U0M60_06165 [Clostridia bacterium]|nr:hypothetical protein [Clostridia bacterium]